MTKAKIAGAPISWGVCEVPGWGHQMVRDRVLAEMVSVGYTACEFGPLGFLPESPAERKAVLEAAGLSAVGGFVPVVLHKADHNPVPEITAELEVFKACGATVMVLAASSGEDSYDSRPVLTDAEWDTMLSNLGTLRDLAATYGVTAVIHPHVGTMVEDNADITRVLNGSDIGFCFDTGHMLIGGTDPVQFAVEHADRIKHVHLKDVNLPVAERVRSGEITYYVGVTQGLYAPLGQGNVDVATIVGSLTKAGFTGWYVLEQDNVITAEPGEGAGPLADARASVEYLRSVL
ncbi:MAG: hypothetical protein RIS25_1023 [Actinomycetota bacterium]|jgi:inosose dehydratase